MASQSRTSRPGVRAHSNGLHKTDHTLFLSRRRATNLKENQFGHRNAFGSRLCLIASLAVHSVGSPRGKRGVSSNAERLRAAPRRLPNRPTARL